MATADHGFQELRQILQKLDRSLDEAHLKRTRGAQEPAPRPAPQPEPPRPRQPDTPDTPEQGTSGTGRLKARPLRRPRPENTSPGGWIR